MKENTYDIIGTDYNSTRQADPFIADRLYYLLNPDKDKLYLDIGCGTGNYTVALAERGLNFYGVDPSEKMLKVAQLSDQKINWLLGTTEKIPTNKNIFDGVIAILTIHHWSDIKQSLKDIYRVLKARGKIVFFTSTPEQMKGYWLNHYFPKMLNSSILKMPSFEIMNDASMSASFEIISTEKYYIKDDLQDHFLYVGKNKPELYFNKKIREGISSFSILAHEKEVKLGLSKLHSDIENGTFEEIKRQYNNYLGDYLFITLDKKGNT
ncbi:MAG: class I SAM-dependent methyltransferase [Bacteroidales bacterium]